MIENIDFFASFGDFTKTPTGGGQTAARRLLAVLLKQGFKVTTFNRHRYYFENRIFDRISMGLFVVIDPIVYFFHLLGKSKKKTMTLYMGYTGSILPFDFLIAMVMRTLSSQTVMYLAGGKALNAYMNGSRLYKFIFKKMIQMFDEVMVEGLENADLVKSISNRTRTFYLPNYTEDNFAPEEWPSKPQDKFNLFYFGRIDSTKNVLLIIDIFDEVCKNFKNVTLTIAGGGPSSYVKKVEDRIVISNCKDKIIKYDRISHEKLLDVIKDKHIFIFPSKEPCEGHSNALNEAMSWGLVPVVSDNNFLPSIVGDESLVAHGFETNQYVSIISSLLRDRELLELKSRQVYERVKNNFTQAVVEERLRNEIVNSCHYKFVNDVTFN